ncbi:prepilin peptidase [Paraburkholderia sp.]|uniref:A24 family peptidase n=1 Tax=Paraburkholderia sp. TaxID=1926495 RepID=UPI0023A58301|nr:prepilin peptidase [Paraburkholderia sp.]MDE1184637.1 prepilin peptidase [Paraburkholderia sp.]
MSLSISGVVFIVWAVAVAVCDCRNRRIPNLLAAAGLVAAFVCAFAQHNPFGVHSFQALLGMAVGFAVLLPFYALGVMGAADVKIFAVLGAWCGIHALLGLWVAASLIGGIHAAALLIATRTPLATLGRRAPTFAFGERRATPYAACLTVPAAAWLLLQPFAGLAR